MITIGIIGCGRIADSAHMPAFEKMDDVRVKYACDVIEGKAEAFIARHPKAEKAVLDYREVLADPEVDAVYVLTPNYAHYEVTMAALAAGKDVFCEKPITVSYELSEKMAKEAEKRGKILTIGVCNRYNAGVNALKDYVSSGKLGNVYQVYCSFRSFRSIPGLGGAFTTKALSGGGVLIDWGVHFLDLILYILGGAKLRTATCETYTGTAKDMKSYRYRSMWAEDTADVEHGTNDVDDFVSGFVRTDKANICFNGAWAQNVDAEEMFIDFMGDKGGARLTYGGKFTFWNADTLEPETPEYPFPNHYEEEDRAFADSLKTREVTRSNIVNILESQKLLGGLYESAEKHEEVRF